MTIDQQQTPSKASARIGPGTFQWNTGGWFGSLFGGTAWLILGACFFAGQSAKVAAIWGTCGVIAIAVGCWLWSQRADRLPFPAFMNMFLVQWIGAAVALVSMIALIPETMRPANASNGLVAGSLLIIPTMMIQFRFMERGSRAQDNAHRDQQAATDESS